MTTLQRAPNMAQVDLGNVTSETQFTITGGSTLFLPLPLETSTFNKPLRVIVGGRVYSATAQNFIATLYWGKSSTIASNVNIANSMTALAASRRQIWMIDTIISACDADTSDAGTMNASFVSTTGTESGALSGNNPDLVLTAALSVTGYFGTSSTSNSAYVDFFEVQQVVS